jgi:cation diffusion facilitator family transporter
VDRKEGDVHIDLPIDVAATGNSPKEMARRMQDPAENLEFTCSHDHDFLSEHIQRNERRTWLVIFLTLTTMMVEIVSGMLFGSMALLADGWHMASHASALGITALAYYLARKHRSNDKFTFGTGKIGDLAGYSSALLLAVIALAMIYASIVRLLNPVVIRFNDAILVAVIGLLVNLVSALLLKEHHDHHPHENSGEPIHDHASHHDHGHDHNLRAAYLHVLADALTSIMAIGALLVGKIWGWTFMDPLMGIVGAVVISRWSVGLMRDSGQVLLDYNGDAHLKEAILQAMQSDGDATVQDLHLWRVGAGRYSAIVALSAPDGRSPLEMKKRLCHLRHLVHVTVEVNRTENR